MESFTKRDIDKSFGKLIKQYRKKNKITQETLAEKLNISVKYISRVENGTSGLKTQSLLKCINILGIEPNLLYGPFITHEDVKKDIDLSNKIKELSEAKKELTSSVIDLLKDFKSEDDEQTKKR